MTAATRRSRLRVQGRVQGVGFRPYVYRLASELALGGWVRNDAAGVEIEVEGPPETLARFRARLVSELPPLARIRSVEEWPRAARGEAGTFAILASGGGVVSTEVPPDAAVCDACLDELFDPRDRRYRYPFINCTHCGPRFTITRQLPYDRPQTSMAGFAMCARCAAEYEACADRRFHAQPNACPACGPHLALLDPCGARSETADPVAATFERIRRGEIVALKGLGGYHLACDARNAGAVARLRRRKGRDEKPFAVMVANIASLEGLASCSTQEAALLAGRERPVTLLRKQPGCDAALEGVAPDLAWLGVLLPYTPLHWLLFHEAAGRPRDAGWRRRRQDAVFVMTSANPSDEPLVRGDAEAIERLAAIADAILAHDREIVVRCDDSVLRVEAGAPAFIRRARGWTPAPIPLAGDGAPVLALGGHLKNTLCVTRGAEAFVSQHVGDLESARSRRFLEECVAHWLHLVQIEPEAIACDLHPDYHSSRLARELAERRGLPLVEVQHHHAHIAALAAEHRVEGPLLGVALDGVGLGADGTAWGGELLRVEGTRCERLGHLAPLALPGGDRAAREPWRMAASALFAMGRGDEIALRFSGQAAAAKLRELLERGANCPRTSSAGRLFDAAAGLLGLQPVARFEGQAAMRLEGLAERHGPVEPLPDGYRLDARGVLDFLPLLSRLADCGDAARGAAVFHATLAAGLADWAAGAARAQGLRRVALGGGCFVNRVLTAALRRALESAGLEVLTARQAPPNDGGISLGQAWVARKWLRAAKGQR